MAVGQRRRENLAQIYGYGNGVALVSYRDDLRPGVLRQGVVYRFQRASESLPHP